MVRDIAARIMASLASGERSWPRANRRERDSHAKVRSTGRIMAKVTMASETSGSASWSSETHRHRSSRPSELSPTLGLDLVHASSQAARLRG